MARALHIVGCCLALAALPAAFAGASPTRSHDFKVIVHPDNPVTSVDRDFLRATFLKKTVRWSQGVTVRPIALSDRFPAHERFTREILGKTPAQMKAYWIQRVFSGTGIPPLEVDSAAAAIAQVLGDRGAIAYVPAGVDTDRAKVVGVR